MKDLLDVSSDPPARPLALSFDDEPASMPRPPAPRRKSPARAGATARLASFAVDGAAVAITFAAVAATALLQEPYGLDSLLREAPLWASLLVLIGVGYSFFFVGVCGRTPGLALAGQQICTLRGEPLTPGESLLRALLAVASVPGLFGFILSLFDPRGQTLHDKLCGCVVVAVD